MKKLTQQSAMTTFLKKKPDNEILLIKRCFLMKALVVHKEFEKENMVKDMKRAFLHKAVSSFKNL
jgi:hypothetical protein